MGARSQVLQLGTAIVLACFASADAAIGQSAFIRGDSNADAQVDLSDAVATLQYLFIGGMQPPCLDAADVDDDGEIAITDPIALLGYLFLGGRPIPAPWPGCGADLTDDGIPCATYPPCADTPEVFSRTGSGDIRGVRWIFPEDGGSFDVTYELIDGQAIAEGDMILGTEGDFLSNGTAGGLSVRAGRQFRWPNGVVPFDIDEDHFGHEWDDAAVMTLRIQNAVAHWNQNTVIRVVPRTKEADYVSFVASEDGCASHVGRKGGRQFIHVVDVVTASGAVLQCSIGSIIHEIGHAVGLWHEQSRCDRDDWVQIVTANIEPGKEHNFDKQCAESLDVGAYDYGSIMHYSARAFGITSMGTTLTTIQPLQPLPFGVTVGQRNGLSAGDIAGVNLLYALPQIWIEDFAYIVGSWDVAEHPRVLADVNGDGRRDVVGFGDRGVVVSVASPTGDSFSPPALWVEGFGPLAGGWHADHPRFLGDVNGDNLDDVVGFGEDGVWVSLSTGSAFTAPGFWLADFGAISGWRNDLHIRLLGDMNGDGLEDLVGFGGPGVLVALSTGGGFTAPTFWVEDFGALAGGWQVGQHPRMLADVNGDGLQDVVGFADEGVWVSTSTGSGLTPPAAWILDFGAVAGGWQADQHPRMLADMDGDGLADIVGFGNDGVWVSVSTGGSFASPQLWAADFGAAAGGWQVARHPRVLADVNGDGRKDVVGFSNEGVWVATSTGGGLRAARLWIDDFGYDAGGWRLEKHVRLLGDVTGDGRDDLVTFGDYGVFVLRSGVPVVFD